MAKAVQLAIQVDWDQIKEKSTCRSAVFQLKFVPPSYLSSSRPTLVVTPWHFEFNAYSTAKIATAVKLDEEIIHRQARALLWFNGAPFPKYRHAMVANDCHFNPALRARSIVLRVDPDEKEINALVWVRKSNSLKRRREHSYFKLARDHTYHLNITFEDGGAVERCIQSGWKFIACVMMHKKNRGQDMIVRSRAITSFSVQ